MESDGNQNIKLDETVLQRWFCNDKNTPMVQIITSVVFGMFLAPWASGLFFLVVFIMIYEILVYLFTHGEPPYYNLFVRVAVICASIFGYILGRTISGDEILCPGVPEVNSMMTYFE